VNAGEGTHKVAAQAQEQERAMASQKKRMESFERSNCDSRTDESAAMNKGRR